MKRTKPIKILIADDHPMIIEGLRMALSGNSNITVVATVSNGTELLDLLQKQAADIIIMDINMPEKDGIVATQEIGKLHPSIRVIAYSQYDDKHFIRRMFKAGARGYLLKSSAADEIIEAVIQVFSGQLYIGRNLPDIFSDKKKPAAKSFAPHLTGREKEILTLICLEKNTREIAETLFISIHTVETHRANLLLKVGVRNSAGLVKWAIENDMIIC